MQQRRATLFYSRVLWISFTFYGLIWSRVRRVVFLIIFIYLFIYWSILQNLILFIIVFFVWVHAHWSMFTQKIIIFVSFLSFIGNRYQRWSCRFCGRTLGFGRNYRSKILRRIPAAIVSSFEYCGIWNFVFFAI